jgi:hypothetical protein
MIASAVAVPCMSPKRWTHATRCKMGSYSPPDGRLAQTLGSPHTRRSTLNHWHVKCPFLFIGTSSYNCHDCIKLLLAHSSPQCRIIVVCSSGHCAHCAPVLGEVSYTASWDPGGSVSLMYASSKKDTAVVVPRRLIGSFDFKSLDRGTNMVQHRPACPTAHVLTCRCRTCAEEMHVRGLCARSLTKDAGYGHDKQCPACPVTVALLIVCALVSLQADHPANAVNADDGTSLACHRHIACLTHSAHRKLQVEHGWAGHH